MSEQIIRVGMIGTSWWADAMHLPALDSHEHVKTTAICGRNRENAQKMADRWNIPHVYTNYEEMMDSGNVDAVVISTINNTHYPMTMYALKNDLHVLCEKPISLTYAEAVEVESLAREKNVKHLVPFTYGWMPTARYLNRLINDEDYIGTPYHLNMRYYTGYAREGQYMWRFDKRYSSSGVLGDLGSHFIFLAEMFYGEMESVMCQFGSIVPRERPAPDGVDYNPLDDTAMFMFTFKNGAQGVIHVTAVCYEDTPFGQTHHMEFHGSGGTLYSFTDWDKTQEVRGAKVGEGMIKELPIPEDIWGAVRRDTVHNTYKDLFRQEDFMVRQWIDAIINDTEAKPNLHDGARIQRIMEACTLSHETGKRIIIDDVTG